MEDLVSKINEKGKVASNEASFKLIFQLIENLKNIGFIRRNELLALISKAVSILENQPNLLKITSPVTIVGDIHGQFYDLLGMLETFGYPPATKYVFLGDYVDRGKFSVQVITLLLYLKVLYPNHIYLLRGNHEGREMTSLFNFHFQCEKKYNDRVYQKFLELFTRLPLCAVIDDKYLSLHGGISPKLQNLSDIQKLYRFTQIDQEQPFFDLLWGDPVDFDSKCWTHNLDRGCSYFYSPIQSMQFLKNNKLQLIIRGHQVTAKGYKYQVSENKIPLTLTIFSAPNYCGTYGNNAVVAQIKNNDICIQKFKQRQQPLIFGEYAEVFQLSLPLLCSGVTKLFKRLLKSSEKRLSKTNDKCQRKSDIKTLIALESIENEFSKKSSQIVRFLNKVSSCCQLSHIDSKQEDEITEQLMHKILRMKIADLGERFPLNFGPVASFTNFNRVHSKMLMFQQDQELTECI